MSTPAILENNEFVIRLKHDASETVLGEKPAIIDLINPHENPDMTAFTILRELLTILGKEPEPWHK